MQGIIEKRMSHNSKNNDENKKKTDMINFKKQQKRQMLMDENSFVRKHFKNNKNETYKNAKTHIQETQYTKNIPRQKIPKIRKITEK